MIYDFDKLTERKGTDSLKYDFAKERGKPDDAIPLWVADMDFPAPSPVAEALIEACRHGIFGYTEVKHPYFQSVLHWYRTHFQWEPEASWLVKTPGVVFAICTAIRAFTSPGDGVMIQRPVYYPFTHAILDNKRSLINSPLKLVNGRYTVDLEDFELQVIKHRVKLFILCNPHNPVGRVWSEEELVGIGEICLKHNVKVISDEIHADFVFPGHKHTVFAGIKPEYKDMTVTCTAPTKTFNLAGLQVSNIFISSGELRNAFRKEMNSTGYVQLNTMGLVACRTAYDKGYPWLQELRSYLADNLSFVQTFLNQKLPRLTLVKPEGTYLLWIDFRALGMTADRLDRFILEEAKLWLDGGTMFGPEGEGFQRINIACPRVTLERAFNQLLHAMERF